MKIIFLDIDGVILAGRHLWSQTGFTTSDGRTVTSKQDRAALPADTVAILRHVIARTGAQIVLSSTWRLHADAQKHMADAYIRPLHPDWRTDNAYSDGDPARGAQIQRWLDTHPDVTAYAILDDDSDMLPSQMPHFVKTDHRVGLTRAHIRRLVAILGARPLLKDANPDALATFPEYYAAGHQPDAAFTLCTNCGAPTIDLAEDLSFGPMRRCSFDAAVSASPAS